MSDNELREERMKILELVSKGVITAAEAEKLLAALNGPEIQEVIDIPKAKKNQFRMLKVYVDSADGDTVRIQIPIEFAKLLKTNKKFMKIDNEEFDIDVDMLLQMINSGAIGELVNVNSADGDTVRIVVE